MEVILVKPVAKLGYPGDLVKVKPGYARNYLFPRRYAIPATPKTRRHAEHLKKVASLRRQKFIKDLEELCSRLHNFQIVLEERTHHQGNLYGSVTARKLAQVLSERSGGIEIDPRWIRLDQPLKVAGAHPVELEPHPGLKAVFIVEIRSLTEILPPSSPQDQETSAS